MKGENIIDSETRVINCIYAALAKNDGKEGGGGVIKLDQTPFSIPHIAVLLVLHTLIIQTRRYTM